MKVSKSAALLALTLALSLAMAPVALADHAPGHGGSEPSQGGGGGGNPDPGQGGGSSDQAPGQSNDGGSAKDEAPGQNNDGGGANDQAPGGGGDGSTGGQSEDAPGQTKDDGSAKDEAPGQTNDGGGANDQAPGDNGQAQGQPSGGGKGGGAKDDAPGQTKGDGNNAKENAPGNNKGDGNSAKDNAPGNGNGGNKGKGNPNPGSGNPNSGNGNDNPATGNDNPGKGNDNPGKGNDKPGKGNDKPGKGNDKPGKGNDKPGKGNDAKGKGGKDGKGRKDVVPGNNGTIKIDGEEFDDGKGNEPHVGCVFQLDFYNFDQAPGVISDVTFTGHAPSGGGVMYTDQVDVSAGEATATYVFSQFDSSGATPHPKQGYHVKVETSTPYSNGADGKSKVFWIDCPPPAPAPSVPAVFSSLPFVPEVALEEPEVAVEETTPEITIEDVLEVVFGTEEVLAGELASTPDLGSEVAADVVEDQVLGSRITNEDAPAVAAARQRQPIQVFGSVLPFTGVDLTTFLLIGLIIVGSGLVVVTTVRPA